MAKRVAKKAVKKATAKAKPIKFSTDVPAKKAPARKAAVKKAAKQAVKKLPVAKKLPRKRAAKKLPEVEVGTPEPLQVVDPQDMSEHSRQFQQSVAESARDAHAEILAKQREDERIRQGFPPRASEK